MTLEEWQKIPLRGKRRGMNRRSFAEIIQLQQLAEREDGHLQRGDSRTLIEMVKEWKHQWDLELAHSQQAESRIKELEEILSAKLQNPMDDVNVVAVINVLRAKRLEQAESRIKVLEEAIEKHRTEWMYDAEDGIASNYYSERDQELYKVLDK